MASTNRAWNLESFLDSLIVELDKARETLAVKAINKPLTYAVKDLNLELQLFPNYDGKKVRFTTAQPGQTGASKIGIQLGSITDQQIRKTTKEPTTRDDISIDIIEEIDEDTKDSLRKIGVSSVNDLEKVEKKNVDLEKVSNKKVNYKKLSKLLQKARRTNLPPSIQRASMSVSTEGKVLELEGNNLGIDRQFSPVAVFNGDLAEVLSCDTVSMQVRVDEKQFKEKDNVLVMALDPFTVLKININNPL
ncbi:MAG TPA: hypothetical protein VJ939_00770 [Bacteroidales bacterium]|nr:hypothetical protein [Bacteroidales bacterium]